MLDFENWEQIYGRTDKKNDRDSAVGRQRGNMPVLWSIRKYALIAHNSDFLICQM